MQDDSLLYDPTFQEEKDAKLTIIVAGTIDAITMVEAEGKEVSNEEMLKTLEYGHARIKEICDAQLDFISDFKNQF